VYFAAREGLLGKELKKIAVEMVREKPPEKPKEPEPEPTAEPPVQETPAPEQPQLADAPPPRRRTSPQRPRPRRTWSHRPRSRRRLPSCPRSPSEVAGPSKLVDPAQLYKGLIEYTVRSRWNRPVDVADNDFVAEVEVAVARDGRIHDPAWKKSSGHAPWDASVREALATAGSVGRAPPTNFPRASWSGSTCRRSPKPPCRCNEEDLEIAAQAR